MKELIRYILRNHSHLPVEDFTVQGFGFMRVRIGPDTRLHIWDSLLRVPGVSDIHDHAQWGFISQIISGVLVNQRYVIQDTCGIPHCMGVIKCGIGGGMQSIQDPVRLWAHLPERYTAGMIYGQEPDEIHRTQATDGTITLIHQRRKDVDTARVFWPLGSEWGDAIPRVATRKERENVIGQALARACSSWNT